MRRTALRLPTCQGGVRRLPWPDCRVANLAPESLLGEIESAFRLQSVDVNWHDVLYGALHAPRRTALVGWHVRSGRRTPVSTCRLLVWEQNVQRIDEPIF